MNNLAIIFVCESERARKYPLLDNFKIGVFLLKP